MEERKMTKVFCKQACDGICCDSDFYVISFPTHNEQLIKKYFSTTDLEIISLYKTTYAPQCEKGGYLQSKRNNNLQWKTQEISNILQPQEIPRIHRAPRRFYKPWHSTLHTQTK